MGSYTLLRIVSRFLLPYILLFGMHVVLGGDISPGGGFQGGVVLASIYLLMHFITEESALNLQRIIQIEKVLFLVLLVAAAGNMALEAYITQTGVLVLMNVVIGMKVALGMGAIIATFLEEGAV